MSTRFPISRRYTNAKQFVVSCRQGKKGKGANPPDMTQHVLAFVGFSIPLNHYNWAAPLATFTLSNRPCQCSFMYAQPIPTKWVEKQTDVKPHKKPNNCEKKIGHNNSSDFVGFSNFLLSNIVHVAVEGCSISANASLGSPWVLSDPYSVAGALCLGTLRTSQPPGESLGTWYPGTWRALQRPSGQPGTTVDAPREPPTPPPSSSASVGCAANQLVGP